MGSGDTIQVFVPLKLRKKNGRPKIMPLADYLPSEDQAQDPHILRAIGRAWARRRPQTVARRPLHARVGRHAVQPGSQAKYTALRDAGKPAKAAIVAVMRKLIEMANALVKADRKWAQKTA
jgi:hypothetical protein